MISEEQKFEALDDAVRRTFEEIAFAETFVIDTGDMTPDMETMLQCFAQEEECLNVAIDLLSPVTGRLVVRACQNLITSLIEMVLGPEGVEADDEAKADFLAEMLNTLAGAFMARICPGEKTFDIGLPEMVENPPETFSHERFYSVNAMPLKIILIF